MRYDFETLVSRKHMGAAKWEQMYGWNPDVGDDVVPLSVADMELKNSPEVIKGLQAYLDEVVLGYTIPQKGYKAALRSWMDRRHGFAIQDEWVVHTPGVVLAFFNAVRCFSKPGDGVVVMSPVYYPFYLAMQHNERKIVDCPLIERDGYYTIDFERFDEVTQKPDCKLFILCNPHNPVGRVWTPEELRQLADIAIRNDVIVVSDEIHQDLMMPGYHHTVFQTVDERLEARVITCTAPSKTFNLAGLATSNIIIPNKALRDAFSKGLFGLAITGCNTLGYKACEIAYNECEAWLEEAISLFDVNQKRVKAFFETHFPKLTAPLIEGTYLQWVDFRALGMSHEDLEAFMHKEALFFTDEGHVFGANGRGFERINLAVPTAVLDTQLERLRVALAPLYAQKVK